jgi:hypothetical protein
MFGVLCELHRKLPITLNRMGLSYVSWVNFSPKIAVDIYAGAELHGGPGGPWTTMRSAHTRPIVDI